MSSACGVAMPPLMSRNGYIVSMRLANVAGGANVLNGVGPVVSPRMAAWPFTTVCARFW